jgi:NAD/NADP transhydrogenase beta subunit
MPNQSKDLSAKDYFLIFLGGVPSAAITMFIMGKLPESQSIQITAIMLASLIVFVVGISDSILRDLTVGAITGIIIQVIHTCMDFTKEEQSSLLKYRITFVICQSLTGFIAGFWLGRKARLDHLPTFKEILSRISGITVVIFALLVTFHFMKEGLEKARTYSSLFSVSTTIFVTIITIPGFLGYYLGEKWRIGNNRK